MIDAERKAEREDEEYKVIFIFTILQSLKRLLKNGYN